WDDDLELIKNGQPQINIIEPWYTEKGRRWVNTNKIPIKDKNGVVTGLLGLSIDITELKRAEEKLAVRLRYESGIIHFSRTLLKESKNILTEAIKHLLEASDVDRVYIFENFIDPIDGLCLRQTDEACALGITPQIDNPELQHVPYMAGFMRWKENLSEGKTIAGLVETFPESEVEILETQNIISLLVLPINVGKNWWGFIGFDDTRKKREWNDIDIDILKIAAEMIGEHIECEQTNKKLIEMRKGKI
ncbi:MAG: GAF domain-containing protein, partial [Promethearchaeota archaeon]